MNTESSQNIRHKLTIKVSKLHLLLGVALTILVAGITINISREMGNGVVVFIGVLLVGAFYVGYRLAMKRGSLQDSENSFSQARVQESQAARIQELEQELLRESAVIEAWVNDMSPNDFRR